MPRLAIAVILAGPIAGVAGCATTENSHAAETADTRADAQEGFDTPFETESLGTFAREFAVEQDHNLVLMNGIEMVQLLPEEMRQSESPADMLRRIAEASRLRLLFEDGYSLLVSPGYEVVAGLDVTLAVHPDLAGESISLRLGADTPVYSALALISHSLDTAVVADNAIASSEVGEMRLDGVTLAQALNAILQSARIPPDSVRVESDAGSVLLRSRANVGPVDVLLNRGELGESAKALLSKRVDLELPYAGLDDDTIRGAATLGETLGAASEQLGVTVTAEPGLLGVPVNPMVARNVSLERAMWLLIRQWPVPDFGYELSSGEIRIRYTGS